jgi:hypothetical protein
LVPWSEAELPQGVGAKRNPRSLRRWAKEVLREGRRFKSVRPGAKRNPRSVRGGLTENTSRDRGVFLLVSWSEAELPQGVGAKRNPRSLRRWAKEVLREGRGSHN